MKHNNKYQTQPVLASLKQALFDLAVSTTKQIFVTTPAEKTKIYGYLEALLGESKSQKELIKEANRNYENPQHWNLDSEYLKPLKVFFE